MMRAGVSELLVFVAVIALGVATIAATSHGSTPAKLQTRLDRLRTVSTVARLPADDRPLSLIGSDLYELGRQSAKTEIELAKRREELESAKADLYDLERVVYFTDCIERRSGRDYEAAFDKGTFNEECKNETNAKTPEQLSDAAREIMAKKAKP